MLPDERFIQVLQYIDIVFRQQIDHADKKAATVIACVAILFALTRDLTGLGRDDFFMRMMGREGIMPALLILSLGLSMTFGFMTITPRLATPKRTILFWRTWLAVPDVATLEPSLRDPAFVKQHFLDDIQVIAAIVERKMFWLRAATWALYGALLVFLGLMLLKSLA